MAKGDRGKVDTAIQQYGNVPFQQSNAMMPQYQNMYNQMYNNYNQAWGQGMGNYNNIMQSYQNFLGGGAMGPGSSYGSSSGYRSPNNTGVSGYGPGGNPMSSPSSGGDDAGFFNQMFPGDTLSPQDILGKAPQLEAAGWKLVKNAAGLPGKLTAPSGRTYDVIQGMGEGLNKKQFNDITGGEGGGGGGYPGAINSALAGYGNFALTGGFSPQDIQDMRARNVAATRASFQQGQDDLSRGRALSGGLMPNYGAAQAKMAREQGYATADTQTNTNAALAQMIQQGKLAGLGGLSQTGLLGQGQNLSALQGMTGLYGTAPGPAGLAQSGALGSSGQQMQMQQLINQMGLGLIGSRMQATQVPSNWQQFMQTWGPIISGGVGAFL